MNIRRLHPQLKVTRTISGRPATGGYPVLGLPKHSPEGKRIRSLVRAPKGCYIGSWDYSQIELRGAAEISGDENMRNVYRTGGDIHTKTAEGIFGVPKEKQDKSKHRLPAKAGNFGYWMGLSPKGLTEQVHKSAGAIEDPAEREKVMAWSAECPGCKFFNAPHDEDCDSNNFFLNFDKVYPKARVYQEARRQHCIETGFAFGYWGEQWYLPGIWSRDERNVEDTARQAFALPIQSFNARLIKQAMAKIWNEDLPWAWKQGARVEVILWIHDEILCVVPEDFLKEWHPRIKSTMETIATLSVPIIAEGSYGPTWLEQTELKEVA